MAAYEHCYCYARPEHRWCSSLVTEGSLLQGSVAVKTAFIGLGLMGYPMAGHLAERWTKQTLSEGSKPETLVWNRTAAKAAAHAAEFGSTAVSLEEAARADVLFSCLPTSREVLGLLPTVLANAQAGMVWVDCTSGDPESSRQLAGQLGDQGIGFLDAPVSGGVKGAQAGKLTAMVGGEAALLAWVRPPLSAFASKIVRVGPVGAGMAVKAGNQALLGLNILALGEVLLGLERAGVASSLALEVLNASSGRSNVSENLFPERVVGRRFPATFALALLAKDVRIAGQMLREGQVAAPLTALVEQLLNVAEQELGGAVDHVAAVQLLERWAKHELGRS
jgi:3-hydroxyisobutyrate dehydrogenase